MAAVCLLAAGCGRNHPPVLPDPPAGPTSGAPHDTMAFTALTTDPDDDDSVSYRFDWGDGDTSEWSRYIRSGVACTTRYAWTDYGSYSVRVRARDRNEVVTDWSGAHYITIDSLFSHPARPGGGSSSLNEY
jgi:hypothetical protein